MLLTKIMASLCCSCTASCKEVQSSECVAEYYERRCKCWTVKVFVNQVIAIETPHFLRVVLNFLKCVTGWKNMKNNL